MKKAWGLIPKILNGEKTIESRWYKNKVAPLGKVKIGDILYFKDSGDLVKVKAMVSAVEQIEVLDNQHALQIMKERASADLGTNDIPADVLEYISNKKYAIFVKFINVTAIEPFDINKNGFGMQSAWLVCEDIETIRKYNEN